MKEASVTITFRHMARVSPFLRSVVFLAFALCVTVSVTSCAIFGRTFGVSGRVIAASSNQPIPSVKVTLLRVVGSGLFTLPAIEPVSEVVTDETGAFSFMVHGERGVLLEVVPNEGGSPDRYTVPMEKVIDGKLRVEIRFLDRMSEIRWNDEDWERWEKR